MTMLGTITVPFHNMSFKASRNKISSLLKQNTEKAMKAIDVFQDKICLSKAGQIGKIGLAGIFAGIFCIFFALIFTIICYANEQE